MCVARHESDGALQQRALRHLGKLKYSSWKSDQGNEWLG
jgi:hypothetical protein